MKKVGSPVAGGQEAVAQSSRGKWRVLWGVPWGPRKQAWGWGWGLGPGEGPCEEVSAWLCCCPSLVPVRLGEPSIVFPATCCRSEAPGSWGAPRITGFPGSFGPGTRWWSQGSEPIPHPKRQESLMAGGHPLCCWRDVARSALVKQPPDSSVAAPSPGRLSPAQRARGLFGGGFPKGSPGAWQQPPVRCCP